MDLFSMGVFDDDDRPKQHKSAPVRCFESELLPPVPKVARCTTCLIDPPIRGKSVCLLCEREQKGWTKTRAREDDGRFMRFRAKLICNGGSLVVPKTLMRTATEFVDAGNAKWATRRDLHRLGLPDDGPRVVILLGWSR